MEKKLSAQQISVMRTLVYGKNVRNEKQARIIREIDEQVPGWIVITSQSGRYGQSRISELSSPMKGADTWRLSMGQKNKAPDTPKVIRGRSWRAFGQR